MITIIGRRLIIPDCDRVLGVTEDANTKIKIKLSSDTVERYFPDSANTDNVGITLVMKYEDGTEFSSVAFTKSDDGVHEGYVNLVGVTKVGLLNARALLTYSEETKDGDTVSTVTTSMQTESDYFYLSEDIEAGDINKNGSTLTAWSQTLEDIKEETKNLDTAVTTATNAALSASNSAETAVSSALDASFSAGNAATSETNAMGYASAAESAKNAAVSAKDEAAGLVGKYSKHLPDYNNPHKVTAEQVGAYTEKEVDLKVGSVGMLVNSVDFRLNNHEINHQNPHEVTAKQVGAYTKEEVDEKLENIDVDVDLSDYVKNTDYATADKGGVIRIRNDTYGLQIGANDGIAFIKKATDAEIDAKTQAYKPIVPANLVKAVTSVGDGYYATEDAVFEKGSFAWTDFENTLPTNDGGNSYVNENVLNVGGTDQPIVVHCAGKTLGFTFGISGYGNAYLTINGETTTYTNSAYDGSEFAKNIVIPPTFMESDIEFSGGMNTWAFTDMTIQSIKGVSELESQIGDIDTALDDIIELMEEIAPTATFGEGEEVPLL